MSVCCLLTLVSACALTPVYACVVAGGRDLGVGAVGFASSRTRDALDVLEADAAEAVFPSLHVSEQPVPVSAVKFMYIASVHRASSSPLRGSFPATAHARMRLPV